MKLKYENLEVWQLAMKLTKDIYQVSDGFPKSEAYGLSSQIRRAAVSVPLNIAEGSTRFSKKEFSQFLRISLGSLVEVRTCLKLAEELGFTTVLQKPISEQINEIYFKLMKLEKTLMTRSLYSSAINTSNSTNNSNISNLGLS